MTDDPTTTQGAGGARPGAGRPLTGDEPYDKKVQANLTESQFVKLSRLRLEGEKKTHFIRRILVRASEDF